LSKEAVKLIHHLPPPPAWYSSSEEEEKVKIFIINTFLPLFAGGVLTEASGRGG
jgi:hypothetical protein